MAAAQFKVIFFFNAGQYGWSETLYWYNPSLGEAQLKIDIRNLASARRQTLGTGVTLKAVRWEDITIPGLTSDGYSPQKLQGPFPSTLTFDSPPCGGALLSTSKLDNPWEGILLPLSDVDNKYRRSFILRGCRATFFPYFDSIPGKVYPEAAAEGPITDYLRALGPDASKPVGNLTTNWCIRGITQRSIGPPTLRVLDVTIVGGGDDRYVVTIPTIINMQQGDTIHISKVNGCILKNLNGDHIIAKLVPDSPVAGQSTVTLATKQCCLGAIDYDGRAKFYWKRYYYYQIVRGEIGRVVKHNTGGPFFSTRGRRRKGCCR